ncbi:hypothetical protein PIB30_100164 [Stylosanthes scabra]|uniref:Uncharacterized protein n=1 Tax=Stylosanthes scabra TaxID=79078 RepID=A0ABU6XWN8_9FABA|nr:hypothetical protein [Stylosanthes scabra]
MRNSSNDAHALLLHPESLGHLEDQGRGELKQEGHLLHRRPMVRKLERLFRLLAANVEAKATTTRPARELQQIRIANQRQIKKQNSGEQATRPEVEVENHAAPTEEQHNNPPSEPTLEERREKARKKKKRMPKRPFMPQGTEGSQVPQEEQVEIPLSQSAPPAMDSGVLTSSLPEQRPVLNLPTPPTSLAAPSFNPISRPFRPKQRIFRAPIPSSNIEVPPAPHVGPAPNSTNPDAISAETLAAASGTTSLRLFKHIPTPGFKPPKQN